MSNRYECPICHRAIGAQGVVPHLRHAHGKSFRQARDTYTNLKANANGTEPVTEPVADVAPIDLAPAADVTAHSAEMPNQGIAPEDTTAQYLNRAVSAVNTELDSIRKRLTALRELERRADQLMKQLDILERAQGELTATSAAALTRE